MVSAGSQVSERRWAGRRGVIVLDAARAGKAYRVEAPDRVLRMFGMLIAARDELDLATVPPEGRARVQRLLEVASAELERSVSLALAGELHDLVRRGEGVPGTAELRVEYASLLGWASGLVVAMLDQLAAARDELYLISQPAGMRGAAAFGSGWRAGTVRDDEGLVPVGGRPLGLLATGGQREMRAPAAADARDGSRTVRRPRPRVVRRVGFSAQPPPSGRPSPTSGSG